MQNYYALIMAGGGGTRLWPMSREKTPKQLLPLIDEHSMFRTSVERLAPLFPPERIYIVAGRNYIEPLQAETPEIPAENFIAEPYGRDSGPAAGLALAVIQKRDPQAVVALLTADHHIGRKDVFRDVLTMAHGVAQDDYIVTLGISPSFPATGFGYIRQGEELRHVNGFSCYYAAAFTEKPNIAAATAFVASGEYSWNSGMFIWKADRAMQEFQRQQPDIYQLLVELQPTVDTPQFGAALDSIWERMPAKSIDFAIMENAERMAVVPVDIGWSDVGSWSSLYQVLELDRLGNCFRGAKADEHVMLDTRNILVFSDRLAVTIGMENIIVVDTDDVLLICARDRAEDVKEVVNHLRLTGKDDYL
jgi:mannose-1-phosphate guanylyltransferase